MDEDNIPCVTEEISLKQIEEDGMAFIRDCMMKFYRIWNIFGIDSYQKEKRLKKVWEYVRNLLQDIFDEEEAYYRKVQENIMNYKVMIEKISKELSVVPQKVSGSLIKTEKTLCKELEMLELLKEQRIKSYNELKTIESKLCQHLSMKEFLCPFETKIPSEQDFNLLEKRVEVLKNEEDKRRRKLSLVKQELIDIQKLTEWQPESRLEKEIILEAENFVLSEENLKMLDGVILKARRQKGEIESQWKDLNEKLTELWEILGVNETRKKEFLLKHKSHTISNLKSIREEIAKCEAKRREVLLIKIELLRKDLDKLWTDCFVSDGERRNFYPYFACEVTENILEAHKAEVEKWNEYYKKLRHILVKIAKREELWNKLLLFENREMNHSRLQNRRGRLLQEEKERTELKKDLPSLENEIFSLIDVYEIENATVFTYQGEDYRVYVNNQWENRSKQKEEKRQNRKEQRKALSTPVKIMIKTPIKPTPNKNYKTGSAYQTPLAYKTPVKSNKVGIVRRNTRLHPNNYQTPISTSETEQINNSPKVSSFNSTTYSGFVTNLNSEKKQNFQSSIVRKVNSRNSTAGLSRSRIKAVMTKTPQKVVLSTPSKGTLSCVMKQNFPHSVLGKAKYKSSPKGSSKSASKSVFITKTPQKTLTPFKGTKSSAKEQSFQITSVGKGKTRNSPKSVSKSMQMTPLKTVTTPTRGKLGLPFLL